MPIDEELMMQVVADWTGIPLSRMEKKESEKLLGLELEIQKHVIGQEVAAGAIARALRRSRADLKDPRRPIGSFMFVGPTGVGKTETAKQLAAQMFGNQDALIQIDMSEYMEKFAVSRLIGSPPGYVGYEEGGQLTEAVRRRPYAVILFDEVEKAHPDVLQLLLQILEDGRLTDSLGRTVDFRNTVIIMTSNIGAAPAAAADLMGFAAAATSFSDAEKMREKVLEEAKRVFKPEFLNRISDIVFFRPLEKVDLVKIVELEVAKFARRLVERKITLEFTEEAKALLIEKGYDEKYGARPLRRAVEHYLEDPLAEALLRGEVKEGELVTVSRADDKLLFLQKTPPAAATGVATEKTWLPGRAAAGGPPHGGRPTAARPFFARRGAGLVAGPVPEDDGEKRSERRVRLGAGLPADDQPAFRRRPPERPVDDIGRQELGFGLRHEGRAQAGAHQPDRVGPGPHLLGDARADPGGGEGGERPIVKARIVAARKEHERSGGQFAQAQTGAAGQRMVARQEDAVALLEEQAGLQAGRGGIGMEEAAGDFPRPEGGQLGGSGRLIELEADAAVPAVKLPQDLREHGRHREPGEGDPHLPHLPLGGRPEAGRQGGQGAEQGLDLLGQRPAGRGQLHAPAGAQEQRHAQGGLELGDLPAERRLGERQAFGGAPEMQVVGDLPEINEVAQFEGKLILARHQRELNKYFPRMAIPC